MEIQTIPLYERQLKITIEIDGHIDLTVRGNNLNDIIKEARAAALNAQGIFTREIATLHVSMIYWELDEELHSRNLEASQCDTPESVDTFGAMLDKLVESVKERFLQMLTREEVILDDKGALV